nr:hypothetical protein GCM10017611_33850 [Rhodococcus wratislaviensis]
MEMQVWSGEGGRRVRQVHDFRFESARLRRRNRVEESLALDVEDRVARLIGVGEMGEDRAQLDRAEDSV